MGLVVDLDVDPSPEAVTFTVTITNNTAERRTLTFPTGQLIDVTVSEGDTLVWQWSGDRLFTQARHERHLDPGASISTRATWPEPTPGTYAVAATVNAVNAELDVERTIDL